MENARTLLLETLTSFAGREEKQRILFLSPGADISAPPSLPPEIIALTASKNVIESKYLIAISIKLLKENGALLIAADNKENGKRLENWRTELGLVGTSFIGHKARCILVTDISTVRRDVLEEWEQAGQIQKNSAGFYSQPGLFSWDRIDPASRLLSDSLTQNASLAGKGADFGCGYGYLSHYLLHHHPGITSLTAIDVDPRALTCLQKNLETFGPILHPLLVDLGLLWQQDQTFDFIVMNPPFHEGRKTLTSLGISFIRNAAAHLRKGGDLWMVANAHLPYEEPLRELFPEVRQVVQKHGFKVIHARGR